MHRHSHLCHIEKHRGSILYGTIQWAVCTDTAISVIWIHIEEASYMAPYNELYAPTQPSLSYEYTQRKHLIWHHTICSMHWHSHLCHMNTHSGSILYGTIQWAVCTDTAISVIWIHRGSILYGTIQWAVCTDTAISVIWIHTEEASYMAPYNELYALTQPSLSYEYT